MTTVLRISATSEQIELLVMVINKIYGPVSAQALHVQSALSGNACEKEEWGIVLHIV